MEILEEVEGFYQVIKMTPFRKTEGVVFDIVPLHNLCDVKSIDRVMHTGGAVSPGPINDVGRPWYMHPSQDDNLLVFFGERTVDIYKEGEGVVNFVVTPDKIFKNGELLFEGGAMLVWKRDVFHRIVSGKEGSASVNFAVHYDGFDIKNNFNIYDVDTETGEYTCIRDGHLDQV